MSKISLTPNASGTGTLTIAAPNTSTDRTLTLPDSTGNIQLLNYAPLLMATMGGGHQTISFDTATKVSLANTVTDTNSFFDTTNNRYLPTIAGYYQVSCSLAIFATTWDIAIAWIYKNNTPIIRGMDIRFSSSVGAGDLVCVVTGIVAMNGTTDYIDLRGYISAGSGTPQFIDDSTKTFMHAHFIREL